MTVGLVVVAFTLNQGCGAKGTGAAKTDISTKHDGTYIGSGSVWTWNLTAAGTFTAIKKATMATLDAAADLNISGTYVTTSTGFYTFTVGSATGTELPLPTVGTTANGFGVPGVVLMVKKSGMDDDLLVMPVKTTTCPTTTSNFNWVKAKARAHSGTFTGDDFWGNAALPATAGAITGKKWRVGDDTVQDLSAGSHTGCTNGLFTLNDGFINMTSAGVGIVKPNANGHDSDIIALPRDTSVTMDTMRKSFVGLVFSQDGGHDKIKPVNITFPATGTAGTYAVITDVTTGAAGETGVVTMTELGSGEKAGFIKMTATGGGGGTPTMWAAVVSNIAGSNRTFFFAAGTNQPGALDPFTVIAIEK